MWWLFFLNLSGLLSLGVPQNISSIGEYSNDKFIWAREIPELHFGMTHVCSGSTACQLNLWLDSTRVAIHSASDCASLDPSISDIKCDEAGSVYTTNITVAGRFDSVADTELKVISAGDTLSTKIIRIKDCDSTSDGAIIPGIDVAVINATSFNGELNLNCTSDYQGTVMLTCLSDATWSQNGTCTQVTTTTEAANTGDPASSTVSVNGSESDTTATTASISSSTSPGSNDPVPSKGLTESYKAGISITVLYAACVVVALILIFALKFELMAIGTPLIILYIVGSVLDITGIIMCFTGTDPEIDMDAVEIAGTVLGSLGLGCCVAGLTWQGIEGSSKDYEPGAAKK